MLQGLLQQRVLLDQLGRGLRILHRCLQHRMRLEELLCDVRILQDGLQDRVLLHELSPDLLPLGAAAHVGAELLRAAGEAAALADLAAERRAAELAANAPNAATAATAADGAAPWAAAEEVLRLKLLLLSVP
jgi:hypothetical protein